MKTISVVILVYNEEQNIWPLYHELHKYITSETEIIFVDDGSIDETIKFIELLSTTDLRIKYISLSRNYGHQIAILAGINKASGEIIITMDGDLQHPPSVIPTLIEKINEDYDVVSARRVSSKNYSSFKNLSSLLFY